MKNDDYKLMQELANEVVHIYTTAKTYLHLYNNFPVGESDLELWNFFAIISKSLWHDIVISIPRILLDTGDNVATLDWFLDQLKKEERLSIDEYCEFKKRLCRIKCDAEPFKRARNKVFAHKDIKVLKRGDPVSVDIDLEGIEVLVESIWSFYNDLSQITRMITVLSPLIGRAGLEQLQNILREYHQGPCRLISKAIINESYNSFTARYDDSTGKLQVVFQDSEGEPIEDIEENSVIKHYSNGRLVGLTIDNFLNR